MKTALIMAAGLGTRFGRMTQQMPKGFVEAGGQSIIERSIRTLTECGVERIIIGTGYHKEAYENLAERYRQITCCFSPAYASTNSMMTLYNCRDVVGDDDFLLLESDIIYQARAVRALMACPEPDVMLITPVTKFQDQYYVEHDASGRLTRCSVDKSQLNAAGELVGMHKLSNTFYRLMCDDYAQKCAAQPKLGYEYELLWMSQNVRPVHVLNEVGLKWYEIDDPDDLRWAEEHVVPYL